jgi:leucyl aminopeptidase
LGEAVALTRRLVNEPANKIYPESFADAAVDVAKRFGLKVEVWDEARLQDERCGSLLAVARGSTRPPRLVILRYDGGRPGDAPLALVGKGVTFDSGGLSLKPSDSMKTMKCDMAGAATVVGAMQAIAQLQLPVNVIGLVGLVENMINGDSYKLGDVLTARSGKTIEVLNTDAEGRLVLADVLDVAIERGAAKIVDLATLTGACLVALGMDTAGLMTNDQAWCDEVAAAARLCGEAAWQLPMFPEFGEQIASKVADIKNVGEGRWGGAITAAKFLEEFVQGKPWVHIDIAGPSFLESPKAWLDAGGSGAFVRTLVEVARGHSVA